MKKTKQQELATEIHRLDLAVNSFAKLMKARLKKKARAGYTGWDKPTREGMVSTQQITFAMEDKLIRINGRNQKKDDAVDIANYAMFLEKRIP